MRVTSKEEKTGDYTRSIPLPGLRAARQRSGMTQRELARIAGVGKGTITELEVGRRGAYPRTMRRLSNALGTEVADLVGE